jgi:hypothetical protein
VWMLPLPQQTPIDMPVPDDGGALLSPMSVVFSKKTPSEIGVAPEIDLAVPRFAISIAHG